MKLSKRISHWREQAKLSQAELSRVVKVSTAAVSQWESGDATPSIKNLLSVAAACGVSMARFWGPTAERKKAS